MIKITGKTRKSEIANAIQEYNGSEIYSYYNTMLPFEHCYHVNDDEYSVKEFCDFVVDNVKEKVNENDDPYFVYHLFQLLFIQRFGFNQKDTKIWDSYYITRIKPIKFLLLRITRKKGVLLRHPSTIYNSNIILF